MKWQIERVQVFSFMLLGSSSILAQVGLLRESLSLLNGNELVVGIFLAAWMLLTGLGSWIGGKLRIHGEGPLVWIHLILPVLALLSLAILPWIIREIAPYGRLVEILPGTLGLLIHLVPVCIPLGMLFPIIVTSFGDKGIQVIPGGYALEGAGSILAGVLLNAGIIILLNITHIWILLIITNYLLAGYIILKNGRYKFIQATAISFAGIAMVITVIGAMKPSGTVLLPDEKLLEVRDTPYGRLKATIMGKQVNLYMNNIPLFNSGDISQPEEDVHFAMALHPRPQDILIISGGNPKVIQEAAKYPETQISFVDMDPWLRDFTFRHLDFRAPGRISIIDSDPLRYLRTTESSFDVIMVLVPSPSTTLLNRYYSVEFIELAKKRLDTNGILSMALPTSGNYLDDESLMSHSVLAKTLGTAFGHLLVMPAGKNYFMASDRKLSYEAIEKITRKDITTVHVNQGYFNDRLLEFRGKQLMNQFREDVPLNRNFEPTNYRYQLLHQLNLYHIKPWPFFALITVLLLLAITFLKPARLGIFTGGFTMAAFQVLIMISFQVYFGILYMMAGVFITLFMVGIMAGTWLTGRKKAAITLNKFMVNQSLIGLTTLSFGVFVWLTTITTLPGWTIHLTLYFLTVVSGFLMGVHFTLGTALSSGSLKKIASGNYGIDLAGSALGTLMASFLLFPVLGILNSGIALLLLNIAVVARVSIHEKKFIYL